MAITVNRYGIHREGELVFLHENEQTRCLTPGFDGLKSPFVVRRQGLACPHSFITGVDEFGVPTDFPDHPLVTAMAPVPHANPGTYWIDIAARQTIEDLVGLLSPTGPPIFVLWAMQSRALALRLTLTNLTPVIIAGYDYKNLPAIAQLLLLPRTRPILFCGSLRPPGINEVLPSTDISALRAALPWRAIGLSLLQQWVRTC